MKRLVITGVTGGLGRHLADRAVQNGYEVIGLARRLPQADPGYAVHSVDVSDHTAVTAFFHSLRGKPLQGLINAAGIASMNLVLTTPAETMARVVGVNLLGTMYCCAEGSKILIRGSGGRILNFSTIAVPLGLAGESVYAASKAGVEGFTRCLARELAPFGVTANVIAPGPIDTPMTAGLGPERIKAVVQRQIIARQAEPEDLWSLAAFLLSDQSAMLSGQVLHLGGV